MIYPWITENHELSMLQFACCGVDLWPRAARGSPTCSVTFEGMINFVKCPYRSKFKTWIHELWNEISPYRSKFMTFDLWNMNCNGLILCMFDYLMLKWPLNYEMKLCNETWSQNIFTLQLKYSYTFLSFRNLLWSLGLDLQQFYAYVKDLPETLTGGTSRKICRFDVSWHLIIWRYVIHKE